MDAGNEFGVKSFEHEGWLVRILLTASDPGGFVAGHADLHLDGAHGCRIALASQQYGESGAILVLEEKAKDFIADWNGGNRTGAATPDPS
jgi:hypothetical protein